MQATDSSEQNNGEAPVGNIGYSLSVDVGYHPTVEYPLLCSYGKGSPRRQYRIFFVCGRYHSTVEYFDYRINTGNPNKQQNGGVKSLRLCLLIIGEKNAKINRKQ
jgi:hypothetical protein